MGVYNSDENYIMKLANTIPGAYARLATGEEDCGYHKADVVVEYSGKTSYLQVSHTEKSKKEIKKLEKRGTVPVHTFAFKDHPLSKSKMIQIIKEML